MTQTATKASTATTSDIYNQVIFMGNLGKDPEMSYTPNAKAVTKFSLAVYQGQNKDTMWLNVECWNKLAEQCSDKLTKGSRVTVEGRLVQDTWKDKNSGEKRYGFKVVAQTVKLVKRGESAASGGFIDESGIEDDGLGDLDDHPF